MPIKKMFKVGLHSKEQVFLPKSDWKEQQTNFERALFDQTAYTNV
jgi:hypothetical protein